MKRTLPLLSFLTACTISSFACFNNYFMVDKNGGLHLQDEQFAAFNTNFNKQLNVQRLKKLMLKLKTEHSYMALSDYAVCLTRLGKNNEALAILQQLYSQHPNEYQLASNLGTTYELSGQVDSALKYIKRGIELNPKDHNGSEWIHVKILETKLQLKKNPDYLKTHTILQLSEKQQNDSVVFHQINIQVRERFPYSPVPDAIMADLMTELGDVSANTSSIEFAKACYQIAKYYYRDSSAALDKKIEVVRQLKKKYINKQAPIFPDMEGENSMMGSFDYKKLLDDNNTQHYTVDWSKINTDVASLLAMVK